MQLNLLNLAARTTFHTLSVKAEVKLLQKVPCGLFSLAHLVLYFVLMFTFGHSRYDHRVHFIFYKEATVERTEECNINTLL